MVQIIKEICIELVYTVVANLYLCMVRNTPLAILELYFLSYSRKVYMVYTRVIYSYISCINVHKTIPSYKSQCCQNEVRPMTQPIQLDSFNWMWKEEATPLPHYPIKENPLPPTLLTKYDADEKTEGKVACNLLWSIIDTYLVPTVSCATEIPDCSLLYSYPSWGGRISGGAGRTGKTQHTDVSAAVALRRR